MLFKQNNHTLSLSLSKSHPNRSQIASLINSIIIIATLLSTSSTQQLIVLYPNQLSVDHTPITIYSSTNDPNQNQTFIERSKTFNCSLSPLYSYKQTQQQYLKDYPYLIKISGYTSVSSASPIIISISSSYDNIKPHINDTKSIQCISQPCTLIIQNGCNTELTKTNYFDLIVLNVSTLNYTLTYYVVCSTQYQGNTFEFGLLIQIIFCTIVITITAIYSNAWSISGRGIKISIYVILIFNGAIVVGGIFAIWYFRIVGIVVDVFSWIFGFAGVWLCVNQTIFLFKKIKVLRKQLLKFRQYCIRVMDIISAVIAIGVCIAWWFSNKNWIISDVISVCMIIAAMKVFKFTSLKLAVICFVITIVVQMVFILVVFLFIQKNYNNLVLNLFNNPFQLQMPTINHVYNQKCAWLPITSIIYPGALMSYMRRFDTSKNTNVYIITCLCLFFFGSLVWMLMSIGTSHQWPFGLIAQPATLGFISLFAWKRKEIRTLWTGKFYDWEFANREGLRAISESISVQKRNTQIIYTPDMFSGLQARQQQSQTQRSEIVKQIQMTTIPPLKPQEIIKQIINSSFSSSNNSSSLLTQSNQSQLQQMHKTVSISVSSDAQSQKQMTEFNRARLISDQFQLQQRQLKTLLFNKKDKNDSI